MKRNEFLELVRQYVISDPESAAYIQVFVADGLKKSRDMAMERASDMEAALATVIARKYAGSDAFVLSILEKWNGKSALNWDRTISLLESKSQK